MGKKVHSKLRAIGADESPQSQSESHSSRSRSSFPSNSRSKSRSRSRSRSRDRKRRQDIAAAEAAGMDMINFTTTFTIRRFSTYVFRDVRIAPFKMEISPIIFECHWKT